MPKPDQPTVIVIFGVTGDLAGRYVLPALYHLIKDDLLPDKFRLIGTTRQALDKKDLLKSIELCVLEADKVCDPEVLKKFNDVFEILRLDPSDEADHLKLKDKLAKLEEDEGVCFNRLFHLSVPPQIYRQIIKLLGTTGLATGCEHKVGKSRLLVEKPFGDDLSSAKDLIKQTNQFFREEQIFRIDHYLAKETAQNILTFRRHNPLFNDVWNNQLVKQIKVRALESIGIEGRVDFYESLGALKDIIQSHLIQLMAISTMDIPSDISSPKDIHEQKIKLLNSASLAGLDKDCLVRGQYESYKKEVNKPDTNVETYVRLKLNINNQRWQGVPIILETGKALSAKITDVTIDFEENNESECNQLIIRLQPDEGIDIKLFVKKPGFDNSMQAATMNFSYSSTFGSQTHPDAYERVIVDAIRGDQSLFASSNEVIRSWEILQPVLDHWHQSIDDLVIYKNGSLGP